MNTTVLNGTHPERVKVEWAKMDLLFFWLDIRDLVACIMVDNDLNAAIKAWAARTASSIKIYQKSLTSLGTACSDLEFLKRAAAPRIALLIGGHPQPLEFKIPVTEELKKAKDSHFNQYSSSITAEHDKGVLLLSNDKAFMDQHIHHLDRTCTNGSSVDAQYGGSEPVHSSIHARYDGGDGFFNLPMTGFGRFSTLVKGDYLYVIGGRQYEEGGQEGSFKKYHSRGSIYITSINKMRESRQSQSAARTTWTKIGNDMHTPRYGMGCTWYKGYLWIAGGYNNSRHAMRTERFDPNSGCWEEMAPLQKGRFYNKLHVVDEIMYAVGGDNDNTISLEYYDISNEMWVQDITSTLKNEIGLGLVSVSHAHMIYVFGTSYDDSKDPDLTLGESAASPMGWLDSLRSHFNALAGIAGDVIEATNPTPVLQVPSHLPSSQTDVGLACWDAYDTQRKQWLSDWVPCCHRRMPSVAEGSTERGEWAYGSGLSMPCMPYHDFDFTRKVV